MFRKIYHSFSSFRLFPTSGEACSSESNDLHQNRRVEKKTQDGIGPTLIIRSLTPADLPQMKAIGLETDSIDPLPCLQSWMTQDPNGIQIALNGNGEIIGACSGVKNGDGDDGMCFVGLFFVVPKYQKQGIGRLLWNLTLQHIGTRNAGLNAVPGKLEIYRDGGGFPIQETRYTTIEYHSSTWPLDFTFLANTPPPGISICPFHSSQLPSIFAYDFNLVGFRRTSALSLNLMEEGSWTLVALRSDGTCAGFGTVKVTCGDAVRVGPLYADGPDLADVLLRRLGEMMLHKPMKGFGLVKTSANQHAMQWMDKLGVGVYEVCDKQYTKQKLDVDIEKIYGQTDSNFAFF